MLTFVMLGLPEVLRHTLATTNPIERALWLAPNVTFRVKRRRDANMRLRLFNTGLLRAEERFRGNNYHE
jgi:hypothetical protein